MSPTQSTFRTEVSLAAQLRDWILRKQAKVGIIGMGYVGLPLGLLFAEGFFLRPWNRLQRTSSWPFLRSGKIRTIPTVLVLGVTYKKDIDATRESPALRNTELLQRRRAPVEYNDRMGKMRKYQFGLESVPLTPETLRG